MGCIEVNRYMAMSDSEEIEDDMFRSLAMIFCFGTLGSELGMLPALDSMLQTNCFVKVNRDVEEKIRNVHGLLY